MTRNLFLLSIALFSFADVIHGRQDSLSKLSFALNYDDVSVGRNVNMELHFNLGRSWNLYGGIKYHLNSRHYKNDYTLGTYFFKESYAADFKQHFGLKIGLEKDIFQWNDNSILFGFYDFQFTSATVHNKSIYWWYPTAKMDHQEYHQLPINSFENNIGIGLKMRLYKNLFFVLRAGGGFSYFISRDEQPLELTGNRRLPLPLSRMFSFGLAYRNNKVQNKKREEVQRHPEHAVRFGYNDIQTGRNFNVLYQYRLSSNLVGYAGMKYHLNSRFYVDYTRMGEQYYFKQFKASNLLQHFGLKGGLEYHVYIPNANFNLYGFYDFQFFHAEVHNLYRLSEFASGVTRNSSNVLPDSDVQAKYERYGPIYALENYLGLGIRLSLTEDIKFRIHGGIGYNFYPGPSKTRSGVPWAAPKQGLARTFGVGLEYAL